MKRDQITSVIQNSCNILAVAWLIFQVGIIFSPQAPMAQRPAHLLFAVLLIFLNALLKDFKDKNPKKPFLNLFFLGCSLAVAIYYGFSWKALAMRMQMVDPIHALGLIAGCALIVLILECVRRIVGWALLGVIFLFLAYAMIGSVFSGWTTLSWVPELIKFSGFSFEEAIEIFCLSTSGLFGITTATSVGFVFYFVMFGAIYSAIGGGQLLIDIALRFARKQRGGAAKAAVLSSSLMGSISGSAVANVATTGIFTIPMMRNSGYSKTMAASIEALASTGGQLAPPIMGVAAFVMAELLNVSYGTIALAGVMPAVVFYFSLWLCVDLHARRSGMNTTPVSQSDPKSPSIRSRWILLLPLLALIVFIALGYSASMSAVLASGVCLLLAGFKKLWHGAELMDVIRKATLQAAEIAIPIAAIGLIIEVCIQSSLVLKFSIQLMDLSGGTQWGALLWIIVGCLIMGLGLPTVAAYIIGATLFVPALIDLGIHALSAHFFVMYYCVLSMITPPVALASYTAAGLAQSPVMKTCVKAFKLSWVAFLIPFAFVWNPSLLGQGTFWESVSSFLLVSAGAAAWTMALQGCLFRRTLSIPSRLCFGLSSILFFVMPMMVDRIQTGFQWGLVSSWMVCLITGLLVLFAGWKYQGNSSSLAT